MNPRSEPALWYPARIQSMILAGTRLGPYEIVDSVGAGGMGQVYSARDTRLDRSVAVKILPPHLSSNSDLKLRFEREARAISGLNHPHICTLHDVGETVLESQSGSDASSVSVSYLVMELCDGQSLAQRLEKGPLPIDQVLRYAIQIAGALDRAHRSGITHRDLKPANIMLTRSGAKLLDFGLAKTVSLLAPRFEETASPIPPSVAEGEGATRIRLTEVRPLTTEGTIVGTFQYMAPEQLEGAEADARSDIFAFGAVLYEMITGKRAFDGRTKASLIASILDRDPTPISEIQPLSPPVLERIVKTCLAKDPDERWQSAHDLMRELEWIRDGISSPAGQPVARRKASLQWLPWVLAGILAIVAAGAGWIASRTPTTAPAQRIVSAIAPPTDAQFIVTGDAGGPVTLSPDGRWVTFVAFSEGTPRLWLQSLETGDARPFQGTENAMFPFWSPSSRSIGFFALGKLKVIDIDGSALRVLAEAPDARGGAWGPDDQIVFAPHTQSGIYRISANGGTATAVTRIEPPFTTHRFPEFLPDGKGFVFLSASHSAPTAADTAVFLGSIDGGATRKLVRTMSHAIPHRDYLLYVQANRLVAHRFHDGALVGEPIRIRDQVLTDPGTWRSIFSVSNNGLLAYHPSGAALGSRLVWMTREGKELSEMPARPIGDIAISPDGEKIAFVIGDPKGAVFIHDLDRGVETRVSFVDLATLAPLWTGDGRHIIFGAVGPGKYQIFIKPVDGSEPERLIFESDRVVRPTHVSPDGSFILVNVNAPDGSVTAMPLDGGAPKVIVDSEGDDYGGQLSPDGRWITYIVADGSGRWAFLAPFPGPGGKWQISNDVVFGVWWNPNGREILYLTADHVVAVDVSITGSSVRIGAPRRLFPVSVNTNNNSVAMTPDGERFLVATPARGAGVATLVNNWATALE
jgi:eukaryotic-like serine/threonine-protein kinase